MARVKVYVDAAYSKTMLFVAAVVIDDEGTCYISEGAKIKVKSSVQAEYLAILFGLKHCIDRGHLDVLLLSDSETAVKQFNGSYKVRQAYLKPYYNAVHNFVANEFDVVIIKHTPGKQNLADKYVRKLKKEYTK